MPETGTGIGIEMISAEDCAACRQCCCFDSYDLWDTPAVSDKVMERMLAIDPQRRFSDISGRRLFIMDREPDSDIHYCPALDRERGCRLGREKPTECSIFPFRVMELCGRTVLALSPVCPAANAMPFGSILEEAKRLAPAIFAAAEKEPYIIRQYEAGYPVLIIKETEQESNE